VGTGKGEGVDDPPDRSPQRGSRWADHREVIEAIAGKYRGSSPWLDLPEELGSRKGAYSRFRRWTKDGTWLHYQAALTLAGILLRTRP